MLSSRSLAESGYRIAKALNAAALRTWGWLGVTGGPRSSVDLNGSDASSLPTNGKSDVWQPVFAALTDRDLLVYDTVPWSLEGWTKPKARIPLIMTRYISVLWLPKVTARQLQQGFFAV